MTEAQAIDFGLMAATAGLFAGSRLPKELIALAALVVGVLVGAVPAGQAFAGFGDDAVVLLGATMLVSTAIARSGAIETLVRPLLRTLADERTQVPTLTGAVALLSVATRSVGALATLLPFAMQVSARTRSSRSALLMPMAFAAMIGGLVTLVGSMANILVAHARRDLTGVPFAMFDFAPVGLCVAAVGLLFLSVGYRLLPTGHAIPAGPDAGHPRGFTAEARMPADSPFAGRTVAELESAAGEGAVRVGMIVRERFRRIEPAPDRAVREGDVLLLSGEPDNLERLISSAGLVLAGDESVGIEKAEMVREGVVTTGSTLVGMTADGAGLSSAHGLSVLAISRRDANLTRRLRYLRFQIGDVLILKGLRDRVLDGMESLRVLPLSERPMALGARHRSWAPIAVLAGAIVMIATGIVPPAVAFAGGAIAVVLLGAMTMDTAYRTIEWPVIVLVAALLPLSEAVRTSGASDLIAGELARAAVFLPPAVVLALTLAVAMVAVAFLETALSVLVLAPIAAAMARHLGLAIDAFLMAVAVGSACGILGSRGRCAAMVMAAGGYRPRDYRRLGLPLALIVVAVGTPLIVLVWGLRAG